MTSRLLTLHLRSRGASMFVAGVGIITLLAWAAGTWLASRPYFDGPAARVPVVALAPLLAALLLGPTLAGADEDLDRSTPLPWRAWRAGHLLVAAVVTAMALILAGLRAPDTYGAHTLVRNALGCIGLVAGGAMLLGARLAWLPAFVYVSAVYAAAPRQTGVVVTAWAWPIQPSTSTTSWLTAVTIFTVGAAAYLHSGSRASAGRRYRRRR
ncbi:hypothetical protein GA0070610_4981 [Micromonospora echinofusca]|uniref:Uncharacterized protein n=1 Tax=Micromonospora echinofusca TaxID=47858 RepID=A0A1C5GFP6_MICEH|nr:hypothetical protein [Micromonospora echinofusca]SCG18633.1 hypothetical protein GA0070610_4981 [Micromonospora echinofusca]